MFPFNSLPVIEQVSPKRSHGHQDANTRESETDHSVVLPKINQPQATAAASIRPVSRKKSAPRETARSEPASLAAVKTHSTDHFQHLYLKEVAAHTDTKEQLRNAARDIEIIRARETMVMREMASLKISLQEASQIARLPLQGAPNGRGNYEELVGLRRRLAEESKKTQILIHDRQLAETSLSQAQSKIRDLETQLRNAKDKARGRFSETSDDATGTTKRSSTTK